MREYKDESGQEEKDDGNSPRYELTKYVAKEVDDISRLFKEIFEDLERNGKLVVDRRRKR